MRVLGIDPGASGAIAVVEDGVMTACHDMPTVTVKGKRRVDPEALAALIVKVMPVSHAFVELVGAMPGNGVSSMFAFGRAAGIVEGVCAGLAIPVTRVPPPVWKRVLRVPADKNAARARASELLPAAGHHWQRVKDDGRAEAALIALYGQRSLTSRNVNEW